MKGKTVAFCGAENALAQAINTAFARAGAQTLWLDTPSTGSAQAVIYVTPAPASAAETEAVELLENAWLSVQTAVRNLRTYGGGALVIVLPPAADGAIGMVVAALRGGLELMARSLATECGAGPAPVRINALAADGGTADDVAALAVFLASEAASFVTGQVVAAETA